MDYKGQADLMLRDAEEFDGTGYIVGDLRQGAQSITDLLDRAEKAESALRNANRNIHALQMDVIKVTNREEAAEAKSTAVMMVNKSLSEALKNAGARAEKAEKERDEALDLIGWIYYEACVSVEHDMRQHLDWLKDKIEEWKKNKEE